MLSAFFALFIVGNGALFLWRREWSGLWQLGEIFVGMFAAVLVRRFRKGTRMCTSAKAEHAAAGRRPKAGRA